MKKEMEIYDRRIEAVFGSTLREIARYHNEEEEILLIWGESTAAELGGDTPFQ